jgi:hypothetical protein
MSDDKPRIQWSATEIVGIGIDNPERVRKTEDGKTVLMPTTYRCPLHQKSGEWPDNPCPVCASNALKLDLLPLELDVEAAEWPTREDPRPIGLHRTDPRTAEDGGSGSPIPQAQDDGVG